MTPTETAAVSPEALFLPLALPRLTLKNRLIRSATYEGWGDENGFPRRDLGDLYLELARGGVGAIITGFSFVSRTGRAMQRGQCGIDADDKIPAWREIVSRVRESCPDVRLLMQLAHAGRQTRQEVTGLPVVGVSARPCGYFRQRVRVLDDASIRGIVEEFGSAARRAREAGFDGVQIHAAHGYLVHQFLSPWTNNRQDTWGSRDLFLREVIQAVRRACGSGFPVLVKVSAAESSRQGIRVEDTIRTVKSLEDLGIDAVEVSYGTMEYALNIIRGNCPVDLVLGVNPLFRRIPAFARRIWKMLFLGAYLRYLIPFTEGYNVDAAEQLKRSTSLAVIPVGGLRRVETMVDCLAGRGLDAVALCRPLICEPDLPLKLRTGRARRSRCCNCNLCTIYCDSPRSVQCYQRKNGGAS